MEPIVRTRSGALRGRTADGVTAYPGIPYAAPLDGPRRFQAPHPPDRWDGVREAVAHSPSVPQPAALPGLPSAWNPSDGTDALSVNVWTPEPGAAGLPVLVWIHGGAYLAGTSADPTYDGAALARGGVVVVTLNYRVGYEGFGWLPDAPANRGLRDQLAALRWVQEEIAGFGGDPGSVTIMGESAGGTSVAALVAGPAAEGLFGRAIAQSASGLFVDEAEARRLAELITGGLGVEPTAAALAGLPPEAVHAAHGPAFAAIDADRASWTNNTPYAAVVDGELLTDLPWRAMRSGAGRSIDLISGFNTDEAALFTADVPPGGADPEATAAGLRLPPGAVERYRAAHPGADDRALTTLLLSDGLFRMPSVWCADAHAAAGGRTHLYEFGWRTPARGGVLGACHSLDVPFTFGATGGPMAAALLEGSDPDEVAALSGRIRGAWTSFAATGDPGWPRYDPERRLARFWDSPPTVVADPVAASRRIWHGRG
ncbi:carboxylesterase/lipase family protein [Saccharopolyspora cebuensis]|uniref:Carboxylic ester hydrolase n=1 Tax=Saccharopolyspora cebuensis TaxID=418759 RepID=A0ABV4CD31_9PSEU